MKISNPYAGIIWIRLEGMISADSPCRGREGTPLFSGGKNTLFFFSARKKWTNPIVSKKVCNFATYIMGKLAFILSFILSVFPADAGENRRHIHVVRRGSKKSHRGDTVAKIWIEKEGVKNIEVDWSKLSAADEAMIIDAIDKHWEELNRKIDEVFAGKKIQIKKIK